MPMTAQFDSRSQLDADVLELVRTLRSYGVLTKARLAELSGAMHWSSEFVFENALTTAVASGQITKLGDELFELSEPERAG
jgi:hypothetical protein